MRSVTHLRARLALLCLSGWVSACATAPAPVTVVAPIEPVRPVQAAPAEEQPPLPPDPVQILIARSQEHFDKGQVELRLGHLGKARAEFDRALDVILESPGGAGGDPRLREHLDRLVDRISAYEVRALMEGDGFGQETELPAPLDELLDLASEDLPPATPALADAVALDLKATAHDIPIPLTPKIVSYIELFQGRLRDWFQVTLQRGQPYMPMIQQALRAEGLPLDLAYLPMVESAFHTSATSRARAKGVWQLMRGTAVEQGLRYDWYVDERANPDKATTAAVRYLKVLNRMFKGDWHLTLASYNGGPGTVQRAMKRRGVSDFWRLAALKRALPRETREYVPMALAAMIVARNPGQYGFTVAEQAASAVETVRAHAPVDLRRVAEWANVPVDEIQRLNPELRRLTTPLRGEPYDLRVPAGTSEAVTAQLASAAPDGLVAFQYHTVKRGESLASIASKLRVRRAELAEANYLTLKSRVKAGDRLVIPRASTTLLAARSDAGSRPSTPAARAIASRSLGASGVGAGQAKRTYRVRKGDTLHTIARSFGTTVKAIQEANGLRSTRLMPGDTLVIYSAR